MLEENKGSRAYLTFINQMQCSSIISGLDFVRLEHGMSIAELARRTAIDKKRLWYVLDGQREMRIDEFLKLCIALRLDPRSFVTREMVEEVAEATRRSIGRSDDIGM